MKAEIISIGDELLLGQVINSNSSWLGLRLADEGIEVTRVVTVGDDENVISNALREALERVRIVILTGGLGPTRDDKTKDVLCRYYKTRLVLHPPALEMIRSGFEKRKIRVTKENEDQAMLPESCIPLKNNAGTAWGMWFERDGKVCVSLPGVPFEMKLIMEEEVIPGFRKMFTGLSKCEYRTLLTAGVPESILAERIREWENALPKEISLAYLPQPGMVRLRVSGKPLEGKRMDAYFEELKHLLQDVVWGEGSLELEEQAGKLLLEKGMTLAVAESCTGGFIGHKITSVPGSSAWFSGGVISYSNKLKKELLGVQEETLEKFGAVSGETAREMLDGILKAGDANCGIAVTGVAGPGGGSLEKPVGTVWIAVSAGKKRQIKKYLFGDHRGRNIQRSMVMALFTLIKLLEQEEH